MDIRELNSLTLWCWCMFTIILNTEVFENLKKYLFKEKLQYYICNQNSIIVNSNLSLMELNLMAKIWCNQFHTLQCKSSTYIRWRFGNTALAGLLLQEFPARYLHRDVMLDYKYYPSFCNVIIDITHYTWFWKLWTIVFTWLTFHPFFFVKFKFECIFI